MPLFAIVGDANQPQTAILQFDADRRGAGVKRVIDQLAHDRGGPLDHLACRDPLDHLTRQQRNPFRHGI
jgi:hypothetical protein